MDYQKLFSFVKNLNTHNECLICRQDTTNQEVNLPCNHNYHEKCIIKNINFNHLKNIRCHYCYKLFNVKSITKKCVICNKKTILRNSKCFKHINDEPAICQAIIKSGPKKNQTCGKIYIKNTDLQYCKKHKNYKKIGPLPTKVTISCSAIIKTGPKKGNTCGKIYIKNTDLQYCKKHKNYKPIDPLPTKVTITCSAIIKTGPKKGNTCGRKCKNGICGYHKVKIIVI